MEKMETVKPWEVDELECYPQAEISVKATVDDIFLEFSTGDTFLLYDDEVDGLIDALHEAKVKRRKFNDEFNELNKVVDGED